MSTSEEIVDEYGAPEEKPMPIRTLTSPFIKKVADYTATEAYTVDTQDHEDHTFCGVMFTVQCRKDRLPIEFLELRSFWVRGNLGPITIWTTPDTHEDKYHRPEMWKQIYSQKHPPSPYTLQSLTLEKPIKLAPGESVGVYIHSALRGDTAIVYDNQRHEVTHNDNFITVTSALAHLNWRPFGMTAPWGHIGWRENREFVGRVTYGVRYRLWNIENHTIYPPKFRDWVKLMLLIYQRADILEGYVSLTDQEYAEDEDVPTLPGPLREQLVEWRASGGPRCYLHHVPFDCFMFMFNFARWDWCADYANNEVPAAENDEDDEEDEEDDDDDDDVEFDFRAYPPLSVLFRMGGAL